MRDRLFTAAQALFMGGLYAACVVLFGLSLAPGIYLLLRVWEATPDLSAAVRCILLGTSAAAGYFLYGFTLSLLVGVLRTALRLRAGEGHHSLFSVEAMKWALVNALYMIVLFTFVDFLLPTPFANVLFRLLGARLGRNVQMNSKYVFDAPLLEMGDDTVVGMGAFIVAHVVERGVLKIKRVKIGKNVTIGTHAKIMPGCVVGDDSIIGAGAVLLKNTEVEPGSVWYGVPARNVKDREKGVERERPDHG
jgi:hypothetical protein